MDADYSEIKKIIRDKDAIKLREYMNKLGKFDVSLFKKLFSLTKSSSLKKTILEIYNERNNVKFNHLNGSNNLDGNKKDKSLTLDENSDNKFISSALVDDGTNVSDLDEAAALKKFSFNNTQKDKCIKLFFDAFKNNVLDFNNKHAALLSSKITAAIFSNDSNEVSKLVRSKLLNLKDKDNPLLCRRVYEGFLTPERFVKMTCDEMKSEDLKVEEKEIIKKNLFDIQIAQVTAETDIFKCNKCGERKCSYRQLQTRSADEPMTTFVRCICGNNWKF